MTPRRPAGTAGGRASRRRGAGDGFDLGRGRPGCSPGAVTPGGPAACREGRQDRPRRTRGGVPCSPALRPDQVLSGTFAPFLRALERPMAIACLGLVTFFFDLPPLLSVPSFISCIAPLTSSWALGPYFLAIVDPPVRGKASGRLRLTPQGPSRAKRVPVRDRWRPGRDRHRGPPAGREM